MEVTFTYDGQAVQVLESTCTDKPTEMWVSKRDLTNDEELPSATLTIKDADGNIVESLVSTDTPHRGTELHLGDADTLIETHPADGYALADEISFRLLQKVDEDGNNLQEAEVYYLTKKSLLFWTWDDWKLLDDATVIMRDDTIKAEFSKKDLTTMEELPGAELTITDKDGKELDRWVSTDKPHYIEKLPAGDYTLTEITAPNGYEIAEDISFTVLPNGDVQRVVMKDAPIPERPAQPTPPSTSTPTPLIPQTGDTVPLGLLLALAGLSLAGLAALIYKCVHCKSVAQKDNDETE